jgi:hypothetical protein
MRWLLLLSVAGCALATGCAPYGYYGHRHYWHRHAYVYAAEGPTLGYHPAEDDDRAAIAVAQMGNVDDYVGTPHLTPRADATAEPAHFDPGAALNALHAVDLAPCASRGAPRGYGHARVTFDADGRADRVVIESPPGLSPDAVACVGNTLGAAKVPPFDGAPIAVGASYRVP